MRASKRDQAKEALALLFEKLSIKRIICVDDVYALASSHEDAVGLIEELGPEAAAPIINNNDIPIQQDRDIWIQPFIRWWESLEENQRKLILQRLYALQSGGIVESEQDLKAATALSELFSGQEFFQLSFTEWKVEKDTRLREAEANKTLFLFDEDLTNDGGTTTGGRDLIKGVLASDLARNSMCGLLSHNIPQEREFEIWKDFKSPAYDFDPNRVVPVSKTTLESRPLQFVQAIKLTVLNPDCHALTKLSGNLIKKSHANAQAQLEEINVYSFDRIVFGASNREGIWEPDTLFRLHNLFQRIDARERAKTNTKLRRLAEKIRSVSAIPTADGSSEKQSDAWRIQRLELYETADFINSNFMPIELGDILESTDEKNDTSIYILLAQPCDLMVRTSTGRRTRLTRAVLARIGYNRPSRERPDEFYELPHFDPNDDKPAYVSFTDTYLVSLNLLDLCVFNSDGSARIKVTDKPRHVVLAWRKYHEQLLSFYRQLIQDRKRMEDSIVSFNVGKSEKVQIPLALVDSINPEFSSPPLFTPQFNAATQSVVFNCRRTGRFEQKHASAMWAKFCIFNSRPAFDVDLVKQ